MKRFFGLIALVLATNLAAQEAGEPLCGTCKTTGRIDNPLRASRDPLENDVIFCSEAMGSDKKGFGCEELVCPKCAGTSYNDSAARDINADIEKRRQWLEGRRNEIDKALGHEAVHIKTTHFTLAFDIPSVKVGQVVYKKHAAAHLYAQRLEELFQEIVDLHGLPASKMHGTKRFVILLDSQKSAQAIANNLTGAGSHSVQYGDPSRVVDFLDKKTFQNDIDYHQHVCHVVSHVLYNDVDTFQNWLVERYGWVSEGTAHFIEMRLFGVPNTWCAREAGALVHWQGKNWEANVKKAVLAGTHPKFEEIQQKPADALSAAEHQFAWSYVDYLVWLDRKAFAKMLGYMKGPQLPVRECLQRAYGISIPAFVEGWETFVKTHYDVTPRKGPQPRTPKDGGPEAEKSKTDEKGQ